MRAADLLIQALAAAGIRHLFSLSGNQIMSIYDAWIDSGLDLIHVRHEAAAVHMANAWGQLTDQPGVALVTAGPGLANTISALYDARQAE
ncbi:MAG: thiamine pyrophosphate-binding protein, partial [Anaerolineales bacterium]|nr:thiamine pyrophosphate-binding protein [Anaerolineales bacterium]